MDAVKFEALTMKFDRSEGKVQAFLDSLVRSGWRLEPDTYAEDIAELFFVGDIAERAVWDISYQLRELPGVLYAKPSFVTPYYGFNKFQREELIPSPDVDTRGGDFDFFSLISPFFCRPHKEGTRNARWIFSSDRGISIQAAWEYSENHGEKPFGEGIRIGHPDSGYRVHPILESARIDLNSADDFIGGPDDQDPLHEEDDGNHGLSTASVILGAEGEMSGVAPKATLIPLRVAQTNGFIPLPVLINGGMYRLRKAIDKAVAENCQVISISLGNWIDDGLVYDAIERAISKGVIVLAAAGNTVGTVVFPARFEKVIGVAGSNIEKTRWGDSCRGPEVDVTAPAESIWRAYIDKNSKQTIGKNCGTSFAVAITAGIAALWLAHHGTKLDAYRGKPELVEAFRHILLKTCDKSPALPEGEFGAGIVNALKVLEYDLAQLPHSGTLREKENQRKPPGIFEKLQKLYPELEPEDLKQRLKHLLKLTTDEQLTDALHDIGDELFFKLAIDIPLFQADRSVEATAPLGSEVLLTEDLSGRLRSYVGN